MFQKESSERTFTKNICFRCKIRVMFQKEPSERTLEHTHNNEKNMHLNLDTKNLFKIQGSAAEP